MGTGLVHRGEFALGLRCGQELVQVGRDGADRETEFLGLLLQGLALLRLGWLEEGVRQNRRAVELGEAVPDYPGRVGAGAQLAMCYLRLGNLGRALEEIEASQKVCVERSLREPSQQGILRNGLTEIYLAAAERTSGQERAGWLKQAQRAGRDALRHARRYRPARSKAMRMWGRYEWLRGRKALARLWWLRSLAEAEALGTPYDVGRAHLEIGLRLGDRQRLSRAEEILTRLGAEWDLEWAKQVRDKALSATGPV
jgi:hypothetical protein